MRMHLAESGQGGTMLLQLSENKPLHKFNPFHKSIPFSSLQLMINMVI